MKYIRAFIIFVLIVWLATAPFAMHARPGSLLYRINVTVNEPVWAWVHITQQGRSETVEEQMKTRYVELERAWVDKVDWQQEWVKKAELLTAERVVNRIGGAIEANDYKVADTLASHALAIARAHKQVLASLITQPGFGKDKQDIAFLDDRLLVLQSMYDDIAKKFAVAYTKTELVRGVDVKMTELDNYITDAQVAMQNSDALLNDQERVSLQDTLNRAKALRSLSKDRLAQDNYVEAYRFANLAQGYALEVSIIVEATQNFGVQPVASPLGEQIP
jgi:hypothetical protein